MWLKNLLFAFVSICGVTGIGLFLLPKSRLPEPKDYDSHWSEQEDVKSVVERVNAEFRQDWEERGLKPTGQADSLTLARRMSLALTGTIPSLEEIRSFEARDEADRIDWYLSHLLSDKRSDDYCAERLARAFVGTDGGPFIVYRRRRFVAWLSDRLTENEPYDQIVSRLVADSGLWTDSPPVNFISATGDPNNDNQPDPIRLAARTSRAFLGMRIDCLQCHDDNLGTIDLGSEVDPRGGTQQDFHQLAAFFVDVTASPRGVQDNAEPDDYKYTYLDEVDEETVRESVPFRPELLPKDGTRRERLAGWLTHEENKPFARAVVNRAWAMMFGRPMWDPIDDIPLAPPADGFPPGMEALAEDFIESGYDLKRLIRLIALTEAFQRDSRTYDEDFEITDEHESAFASFRPVRLRPEQVAGSVIQATSLSTIDASANVFTRLLRFGNENEFVERFGDRGEEEFAEQSGTIPQQLLLMNGKLVAERSKSDNVLLASISQLAVLAPTPEAKVDAAYLAVLTRYPSEREREYFARRFEEQSGDAIQREMEDLFWVLFKSPDFVFNR